jgi:transposase InsO family protein
LIGRQTDVPKHSPSGQCRPHSSITARNLLARDFTPAAPDRVWRSDITYIATDVGWLYLAAVIDLFSRQVVGWSKQPHMQPHMQPRMQPHMQASLVTDALRMAWFRRHPEPGLIFHSDRGSQYCSR